MAAVTMLSKSSETEDYSAGVPFEELEDVSQCSMERRQSVAAESFNPDEDDGDDTKVLHPKSDEQRGRLVEAVRPILLFRSLDEDQMQDVIDAIFEKRVEPGAEVITQGEDGDNFYVIESGIYDITVRDDKTGKIVNMGTYDNNGFFGELALMYNTPRAATITARTEGILWAMDRATFRRIVLRKAAQKRHMYEGLLTGVSLLSELNPYERISLADALHSRCLEDGEMILVEGERGEEMFFVEEGEVKITCKNQNDAEVHIKTLTKGDYFGELALITQKPRVASARAIGKVKVAVLDVAGFERLLGPCLDVMKRNIDAYKEQLEELFGSDNVISSLRSSHE